MEGTQAATFALQQTEIALGLNRKSRLRCDFGQLSYIICIQRKVVYYTYMDLPDCYLDESPGTSDKLIQEHIV